MTLKEYLSGQHAPPEIQEKMERLFAVPAWLNKHSERVDLNLETCWVLKECALAIEKIVLE